MTQQVTRGEGESSSFVKLTDSLRIFAERRSIVFLAAIVIPVALLANALPADPDLFHRLASGSLIFSSGQVPHIDPFAFTPTLDKWIDHEWLSGVVFYALYWIGGDSLLLAFRTLMFAFTCAVTTRAALLFMESQHTPQKGLLTWLLVTLLHARFAWVSVVRCQVFTYLFIPLLYLAWLEYSVHGRKALLRGFPLVFLVWCNLHGGFVLGLVLLTLLTAGTLVSGRPIRELSLVLVTSIAFTALNPYGFIEYWTYLIEALSMTRPSITEWAPLISDWDQFLLTTGILLPVVFGVFMRPLNVVPLALLIFTAYCGYSHVRFLACAMLTASVFGAPYALKTAERVFMTMQGTGIRLQRLWSITLSLALTICLGMIARSAWLIPTSELDLGGYPADVVKIAQEKGLSGKMLVDFNVGAFVLWKLYPNVLVSMDSRYETVYPESTGELNSWAYAFGTEGSTRALDQLKPDHILVNTGHLSSNAIAAIEARYPLIIEGAHFSIYSAGKTAYDR